MTTPLPKTLDLSLAAEGVGNAVIVPAEKLNAAIRRAGLA